MGQITEANKLHYLIKDESNKSFIAIHLQSYMEIPQHGNEIKLRRIESIDIFFSTDMKEYEVGSFRVNMGRNDCHYSGHKNVKDFIKNFTSKKSVLDGYSVVTKDEYLQQREKVFALYNSHPNADYSKLEEGSEFPR